MINYAKFQKECVDRLLRGGRVGLDELGNGQYIVSYNGIFGLVLNENQIVFNKERCYKADLKYILEPSDEDVEIAPTKTIHLASNGYKIKFSCEKFDIWFDKKNADVFPLDTVWKSGSPVCRAIAYNKTGERIGVLMPIRVNADW